MKKSTNKKAAGSKAGKSNGSAKTEKPAEDTQAPPKDSVPAGEQSMTQAPFRIEPTPSDPTVELAKEAAEANAAALAASAASAAASSGQPATPPGVPAPVVQPAVTSTALVPPIVPPGTASLPPVVLTPATPPATGQPVAGATAAGQSATPPEVPAPVVQPVATSAASVPPIIAPGAVALPPVVLPLVTPAPTGQPAATGAAATTAAGAQPAQATVAATGTAATAAATPGATQAAPGTPVPPTVLIPPLTPPTFIARTMTRIQNFGRRDWFIVAMCLIGVVGLVTEGLKLYNKFSSSTTSPAPVPQIQTNAPAPVIAKINPVDSLDHFRTNSIAAIRNRTATNGTGTGTGSVIHIGGNIGHGNIVAANGSWVWNFGSSVSVRGHGASESGVQADTGWIDEDPTVTIQGPPQGLLGTTGSWSPVETLVHESDIVLVLIPDGWQVQSIWSTLNVLGALDGKLIRITPGTATLPQTNRVQHHEYRFRLKSGEGDASLKLTYTPL